MLSHPERAPACLLHYEAYLYVNIIVLLCADGKCVWVTMTSAVQTNEQLFMQSTAPCTNTCLFSHREYDTEDRAALRFLKLFKCKDNLCSSGVSQWLNMTQVSRRLWEAWGEMRVRREENCPNCLRSVIFSTLHLVFSQKVSGIISEVADRLCTLESCCTGHICCYSFTIKLIVLNVTNLIYLWFCKNFLKRSWRSGDKKGCFTQIAKRL